MNDPVVRAPQRWLALGALTPARLALGQVGVSQPTAAVLRFGWDHAQARDAVHQPFDADALARDIGALGLSSLQVASRAPDRATYLMRPDLGRRLSAESAACLDAQARGGFDLLLVVGDGLSSSAMTSHVAPLLRELGHDWAQGGAAAPGSRLGPIVIASQARVALADDIGERLGAPLVAILIGERPGLSSPDSLGVYLTWAPRIGRTDAERNCLSNIRPQGLSYAEAARRLTWLCREANRLQISGVGLKDRSDTAQLGWPVAGQERAALDATGASGPDRPDPA
jgi:ethanolamine ammonia-lyase small subunit